MSNVEKIIARAFVEHNSVNEWQMMTTATIDDMKADAESEFENNGYDMVEYTTVYDDDTDESVMVYPDGTVER